MGEAVAARVFDAKTKSLTRCNCHPMLQSSIRTHLKFSWPQCLVQVQHVASKTPALRCAGPPREGRCAAHLGVFSSFFTCLLASRGGHCVLRDDACGAAGGSACLRRRVGGGRCAALVSCALDGCQ